MSSYIVRVLVGSHIGQYRIVRKIGAGGMGNVFLGEHTLLGRRAAIKTLLPALSSNHEIVERFFNEARATSSISDPGIIAVFDFGYHVDGTAYIVMELLQGEALSARIDRLGKLPVSEALRIARQGAGSLAVAHAASIVHRDLKPQNVFLVRDAEAQGGERTKILDFGICKQGGIGDQTLTQSGAMIGTPVYMSPEQCRGLGEIDHRSDIYAFGCLIFHMLTGRPPFVGEAPGDLIVAHLREAPPAPSLYIPELPPSIDALLARCLAKDPAERFQSMTELQKEIEDVLAHLGDSPVVVVPPRPTLQLGEGFCSEFQGSLASPPPSDGNPIPKTPQSIVPDLDAWVMRTGQTPAPNDDVYGEPPPRSGVRTVVTISAVAGMLALLIAASFVLGNDDAVAQSIPAPTAVSAQTAAPLPAAQPAPAQVKVTVPIDSPQPIDPPAVARPTEIPVQPVAAEAQPVAAEAQPVSEIVTPAEPTQETPLAQPAARAAATRAANLAAKKKSVPRPRPISPKSEPVSHPIEDLYDAR